MGEFGWPRPPEGMVDKKECDQLIFLAKTQWTIFLGIRSEYSTKERKHKKEWIVLNITNGELVFRIEQERIIDERRTAIIRTADGNCVMRHVYDKNFLREMPDGCDDVPLTFPEAQIHRADEDYPIDGINMSQIPGGYILCTVLSGKYKDPEHQKLAGRVTVCCVRSCHPDIIGYTPIVTRKNRICYPYYFAPGKILIKPSPRSISCPEIWKIGTRLEFDSLVVEDISSINKCFLADDVHFYPSPSGHLVLFCLGTVKIVKRGENKISHSFSSRYPLGWVGPSHFAVFSGIGVANKLINVETGEEKSVPGDLCLLLDCINSVAIVKGGLVEVWRVNDFVCKDVESSGPALILRHPLGVKIEGHDTFNASCDGLHMVTVASDDVIRLWRKDTLIAECELPMRRHDYRHKNICMSILDPEMDWVEAMGQWLLYSLHGRESTFLDLGIISIILTFLI